MGLFLFLFCVCVWVMVDFFHMSHSWLDDRVLVLTHSWYMARVGAMIMRLARVQI